MRNALISLSAIVSDRGLRPSVNIIAEYFRRFFMGYRPMSLRMPTSSYAAYAFMQYTHGS